VCWWLHRAVQIYTLYLQATVEFSNALSCAKRMSECDIADAVVDGLLAAVVDAETQIRNEMHQVCVCARSVGRGLGFITDCRAPLPSPASGGCRNQDSR
jgi:hypothetical protein